jgi:hypothetical protein
VTVVDPLIAPKVAVIVTALVELASAFMRPVLLTLTTEGAELVQVTLLVIVFWLPSSYTPVATICRVWPTWREGLSGVTLMLVNVGFTKNPRHPAKAVLNNTAQTADSNNLGLDFSIPTS